MKIKFPTITKGLHWTTVTSERALLAVIGIATCIAAAQYLLEMFYARKILLADLFMLFIFVEIIEKGLELSTAQAEYQLHYR